MKELDKLNRLTESHGALRPGKGLISGVIAPSLAIPCFLGVVGDYVPNGFFKQLMFPFRWKA